jgi:hypothetical protein
MAINTAPIYTGMPNVAWAAAITGANTAKDGTGTVSTIFTAGAVTASNPGLPNQCIGRPYGTNTASVARLFYNNGATNATPANNSLVAEQSLPATTLSEVASIAGVIVVFGVPFQTGYKINVCQGTAVAAGVAWTCVGGDY